MCEFPIDKSMCEFPILKFHFKIKVEGILIMYDQSIRDLMDMKIFVEEAADVRLSRRILRDIKERARDLEGVLSQYERHVKPAFEQYIQPTKKWADVIIPRGKENFVAISLIVQHIQTTLQTPSLSRRETQSKPSDSDNLDSSTGSNLGQGTSQQLLKPSIYAPDAPRSPLASSTFLNSSASSKQIFHANNRFAHSDDQMNFSIELTIPAEQF